MHDAKSDKQAKAIPIKCFISHRPLSPVDGSVSRAKKEKEGPGDEVELGCLVTKSAPSLLGNSKVFPPLAVV